MTVNEGPQILELDSARPRASAPSGALDLPQAAPSQNEAYLVGIFLLALLSRVAVVLHPADVYLGTGLMYDQLGLRIAVGLGFGPTSMISPVYPFYLAMFYKFYGYSHHAIVFSQALLGALVAFQTAILVRYIGLGRRYAVVAGVLVALFPQSIAQVRHLSPQVLNSFLFLLGTFFWVKRRPTPRIWESLLSGFFLGLSVLGRVGLVLPSLALLAARGRLPTGDFRIFRLPPRTPGTFGSLDPENDRDAYTKLGRQRSRAGRWHRSSWLPRLVVLLLMAVVVAPWVARNTTLHQQPVFVDSTWAMRLRAMTIPGSHSVEYRVPGRLTVHPDNLMVTDNKLAFAETIGFALTHPGKLARIWGRRSAEFVGFSAWNDAATLDLFPYEGFWYRTAQAIAFGVLMSLALVWLILLRGRGAQEQAIFAGLVGVFAMAVIGGGVGDGRLFALPLLVVLAMRGAWGLLVLTGVRLRTPRPVEVADSFDSADSFESESNVQTFPLPVGVEPAGTWRWILFTAAVAWVWVHGIAAAIAA